jgi:hypothetical protein
MGEVELETHRRDAENAEKATEPTFNVLEFLNPGIEGWAPVGNRVWFPMRELNLAIFFSALSASLRCIPIRIPVPN